jgi:hypothetical protein
LLAKFVNAWAPFRYLVCNSCKISCQYQAQSPWNSQVQLIPKVYSHTCHINLMEVSQECCLVIFCKNACIGDSSLLAFGALGNTTWMKGNIWQWLLPLVYTNSQNWSDFCYPTDFCQAIRPIFVSIDTPHLHETQNRMHYLE